MRFFLPLTRCRSVLSEIELQHAISHHRAWEVGIAHTGACRHLRQVCHEFFRIFGDGVHVGASLEVVEAIHLSTPSTDCGAQARTREILESRRAQNTTKGGLFFSVLLDQFKCPSYNCSVDVKLLEDGA